MMRHKLGLKPPRPGAVKMQFRSYAAGLFPKIPDTDFGHDAMVDPWHILGNDSYGNCAFAGAAHEHMLWTAEGSVRAHFTIRDVLSDYGDCTGFRTEDPATDQGTDMQQAASYRRKTGIVDTQARRHKVRAYAALDPGNIREHRAATYLFSVVGLGINVGDNQQDQFTHGLPWDGPLGSNPGAHYVPLVAFRSGHLWVVTWGKLQAVTPAFFTANNDQSLAYFSDEMLRNNGRSLEDFDLPAMLDDLGQLTRAG